MRLPFYPHTDMKISSDTIAAIATAPGESGIAIVRISGPQSLNIADKVFRCKPPKPSKRPANSFSRGFIHSSKKSHSDTDIDEVILLIYRTPHSYTREDVVEIQGHGGRACAQRILNTVLDAGAMPAEPGEFTKRAFLNGRIDLLQAEAVADLIRARSQRAAFAALEQLEGHLSSEFANTYDSILHVAAGLEATLDFPEDELPTDTIPDIIHQIESVVRNLNTLLATWEEGHLLREGALVVISGRPNVGKSTLLNYLLGKDRAIVAEVPGTTRDTVEEEIILDGVVMRLVDTAGLRKTECDVERQGVKRAQAFIERCDINLYMIDSSQPISHEDLERLKTLDPAKCIVVLNKTDLGTKITAKDFPCLKAVECSLLKGDCLQQLRESIISKLGIQSSVPPHAVISTRHRQIIQNTLNILNEVSALLKTGEEEAIPLVASSLRTALEHLGTVTGKVYNDELLNNIFSRFCIGK